jgi:hypothetical protein
MATINFRMVGKFSCHLQWRVRRVNMVNVSVCYHVSSDESDVEYLIQVS